MPSNNSQVVNIGSVNGKNKIIINQTQSVEEKIINLNIEKANIFFDSLQERVNGKELNRANKAYLRNSVQGLRNEVILGDRADESKLQHFLADIRRMAPDIFDVIFQTAINPMLGLGTVLLKIVRRIAEQTS